MTSLKLTIAVILLTLATPVLAIEDASSSAQEINQNLKQRIQEVVKDKLVTTEKDISADKQESALVGYVGIITKINEFSLTVNTDQEKTLQVTTNQEETDIIRNGQKIKANKLSIDEKIIIIGQLNTEDILSAKRIVAVKPTTPKFKRQTIVAAISNLNLKGRTLNIGEFNVDIPKKSDLNLTNLQENQLVMAIIKTDLKKNTHTLLILQPLLQ